MKGGARSSPFTALSFPDAKGTQFTVGLTEFSSLLIVKPEFILMWSLDFLHVPNQVAVTIQLWYLSYRRSALALLHSEWPKLHRVLAVLSAIGLRRVSADSSVLNIEFLQLL